MERRSYDGPERQQMTDDVAAKIADATEHTAKAIENTSKIAKPIWAMVCAMLALAFGLGGFWHEYKYNAEYGSPAVRELLAGQQKQIDRLIRLVELQEQRNAFTENRLQALESRK
jgi:hypothetical protein